MTAQGRVDGRQARGDRARAALIAATLSVIEREGIGRVTHRNVTRVAGVPATSAAYHFDTINELLEAALLWADEQSKLALVEIAAADDPVQALATWLVADFEHDRARCLAEYELFLYAARTPALRTTARRWMTDLAELVSHWTEDPMAITTICAYVDGLILQALVTNEAPDPATFAGTIRALIGAGSDAHASSSGHDRAMASYSVNQAAVDRCRELIDKKQYVLNSDWGDVQPDAEAQNAFLESHSWEEYAGWHLGLTEGANDETKARFAFTYGDLRRVHRTALIACVYRASEWRHKDVELAAHDLLQHLDKSTG